MEDGRCPGGFDPRAVGDPVDTLTGAVVDRVLDFRLIGPLELRWTRHYDSSLCEHVLSVGRGWAHEFDRSLKIDEDALVYEEPVRRVLKFPLLPNDGDEFAVHGFRVRRESANRFFLFTHAAPAMEFIFRPDESRARLARLFRGNEEVRFWYDRAATLVGIDDSAGRRLTAEEDNERRLIRLAIESTPAVQGFLLIAYEYDDRGNLIRTRNAEGHGYTYEYDAANRLIRRHGRKGFRFQYTYDADGRCVRSMGDGRLYGAALEYKIPSHVTKVTRPDRGVWAYTFTPKGELHQVVDPLGGVQKFIRDPSGRQVQEVDPNGNVSTFNYDAAGAAVARIDPLGHRIALPEDPNAPDPMFHRVAANAAEYEYGRLLNIDTIALPDEKAVGELGLPRDIQALIVVQAPRAPPTADDRPYDVPPLRVLWWPKPKRGRVFNELGKLIEQRDDLGRMRRWSYDESGNVATHTDFDGGRWVYDYGAWHFLRGLKNPIDGEVRYTHTPSGEVETFTDAAETKSEYGYDLKDHLVEVRRHGVVKETYTRDACGNLIAKHAGDGRELLRFEIGHGNLPIKRSLASGDEHTFEYDQRGRLLVAATKTDRVEFAYDLLGNPTLDKRNGVGVAHRYQGWRRPSETVFLDRFTVRYAWDGNTLTIIDPGGAEHSIRFHGHGIIERRLSNGSREWVQYDALGRCLLKHAERRTGQVWTRRYHWSGEGELRRVADNLRGEVRHDYDAAHRLRRRIVNGRTESYTLDSADNLVAQPGLDHVQLLDGNRLAAANGERFTYNDRNHIETRRGPNGTTRYTYDSRDQLVRADVPDGVWEADYDALGRRTRKSWNGETTEFYWNGDQVIGEINGKGGVRLYIYGDPLALNPLLLLDYPSSDAPSGSCQRYFVYSDQIGTPRLIENDEGVEVWCADVIPFGSTNIYSTFNISFNVRFPGHYLDVETGLHYNRFRYYNPNLGRYLQSDPWGIAGTNNLYAYLPNPLLLSDIRGLGDDSDPRCRDPEDDAEGTTRQSIADREAEGGVIPQFARDNPDLYEFDTASGRYRRREGEGHSRSSEFGSGYRQDTHDEMAMRHTDEGRAQGRPPVDANGDPIPHDQLTWRDSDDNHIPYHDDEGQTNLTYDHQTSCVDMYNDGATVTNPTTGETTTYPPGRDTDRATRNDFYNDPNNLTPMSRSDNSRKGGGGQTYNSQPPGPNYSA
jgi:RHS repeat-associated protein